MSHRRANPHAAIAEAERAAARGEVTLDKGLNKVFKRNPSIEIFLGIRRKYPNIDLRLGSTWDFFMIWNYIKKFNEFGIDQALLNDSLARIGKSNVQAISELSLTLLESLLETRRRAESGDHALAMRGKVIPNKLIDWAVVVMLEQFDLPRDLMVLARERLGGANLGFRRTLRKPNRKREAVSIAVEMALGGIKPSYSAIAREMGCSKSTVSRWFRNTAELLKLVEDRVGNLKRTGSAEAEQSLHDK